MQSTFSPNRRSGFPYEIQLHSWEEVADSWKQSDLYLPYWRMYWNFERGGILSFPDETEMELPTDTIVIIPGYLRFSTYSVHTFDQLFIHFQLRDDITANTHEVVEIPGDDFIRELSRNYKELFQQQTANKATCEIIAHTLLGYALFKGQSRLGIRILPAEQRILDCLEYIKLHLASPLDNNSLARHCNMTTNAFIRLFSSNMNESPQQFVRRKRMEEAYRLLLLTTLSIKEISQMVGFGNPLYFTKVFTRFQHMPPRVFRQRKHWPS